MASGLYKNEYRIKSARHPEHDYSGDGIYFVTICAHGARHLFGTVSRGEMVLNKSGEIVKEEWLKTEKLRPYLFLDEFIVMPNHFHGIVIIDKSGAYRGVETPRWGVSGVADINVLDAPAARLYDSAGKNVLDAPAARLYGPPGLPKDSLGSIINQFKGACTKRLNEFLPKTIKIWQSRYYDRVVREDELRRIRQYILDNPGQWEIDKGGPENIWF